MFWVDEGAVQDIAFTKAVAKDGHISYLRFEPRCRNPALVAH